MSHHLDTPLAAQNGQLYIDDLYVFSAADSTVFVMDVNSNITGVHVKPGFHHEARYEFKVHFDGEDFESLTYRVSFDEAGSDGRQAMKLRVLTGKDAREDSATGELMLEGRTGEPARRAAPGSGQGGFRTRSTSISRCSRRSTGRSRTGLQSTCQHGGRRTRRTASPARRSNRSCSRSPTSIPGSGPAPGLASGARPSLQPTPAAGGRSTGAVIP